MGALAEAASPPTTVDRVTALDAFRGFTMIMMVSEGFGLMQLKDTAALAPLLGQFQHAPWIGMTAWDMIQPFFMFIVGAVMPWSFAKRPDAGWGFVLKRSALLLLWGVIARSIRAGRPVLDVINVLAQLAVTYPIAFAMLKRGERVQLGAAALLLVAHTVAFIAYGNPWVQTENLGEVIDQAVFGKSWGGHYATINCLSSAANTLLGVVAGEMLRRGQLKRLATMGGILLAGGLALSPLVPVIKKIWTASFAMVSGGITVFALLLFWYLCEQRGWRMKLFVMVGANSIFIYLFHEITEDWLTRTAKVFTGWGTAYWPAPLLAVNDFVVVAFQIWLCVWLYRRKLFFKL
jgi:predicted acyltransferase